MNNPYPSKTQLHVENTADRLLVEQAAGTAQFRAIMFEMREKISKLCLPLGCPAPGYGMDDIDGFIADWLTVRSSENLADLAEDAALKVTA